MHLLSISILQKEIARFVIFIGNYSALRRGQDTFLLNRHTCQLEQGLLPECQYGCKQGGGTTDMLSAVVEFKVRVKNKICIFI